MQIRNLKQRCGSLSVSDPRWRWLGLTCETTTLLIASYYLCLYAPENCSATIQATGSLFGKL